jgi:predicted ester cyclase
MNPESIRSCGRRLVDEVLNQGDLAVADQIIDARCTAYSSIARNPVVGLEQTKHYIVVLRRAIPDISVRIDDDIVEGDTLVQRLALAGTHSGRPFLGQPARGSPLIAVGVLFCRINSRGKIRECWLYADQLDVLRQITATSDSIPDSVISKGKQ